MAQESALDTEPSVTIHAADLVTSYYVLALFSKLGTDAEGDETSTASGVTEFTVALGRNLRSQAENLIVLTSHHDDTLEAG